MARSAVSLSVILGASTASALLPHAAPTRLLTPLRRHASVAMAAEEADEICVDEICEPIGVVMSTKNSNGYAEESRKFRRTVYMHDEWVRHRSSERFFRNMKTINKSGVGQNLGTELAVVTGSAIFAVFMNCILGEYQDFDGVKHPGPLADLWLGGSWSLPAMPFTVAMPALALLLVFRTNTGYSRWNEARTLWGGVVNTCRNVVRQANTFYPDTAEGALQRDKMKANTQAMCKALRNFLRGPEDDAVFRAELMELTDAGLLPRSQVDACMNAKNRPMFCLQAMSANLRAARLEPMDRSRIDASIATLVDLVGACERIFKSPVPLVYTRHTARFLTSFMLLLPFGLWESMGGFWNHWVTVPATFFLAFFLFGIEEIGIQIEEPFSILPLEALCNGAISATVDEITDADKQGAFSFDPLELEAEEPRGEVALSAP